MRQLKSRRDFAEYLKNGANDFSPTSVIFLQSFIEVSEIIRLNTDYSLFSHFSLIHPKTEKQSRLYTSLVVATLK